MFLSYLRHIEKFVKRLFPFPIPLCILYLSMVRHLLKMVGKCLMSNHNLSSATGCGRTARAIVQCMCKE